MSRTWARDFGRGTRVEQALATLCLDEGWLVLDGPKTHVYDKGIITPRRIHLVEVKDESNYSESPNLCIELFRGTSRRPTGLNASESSLTVHFFGSMWVLYRTQSMREWLPRAIEQGLVKPPVVFGKADNLTGGVLIPRSTLMRELWYDQQPDPYLCRSVLWMDDGRNDDGRP